MKKILTLLLSVSLLFTLVSCGEEKKAENKPVEEETKWFMAQTDKAPVSNVSATSELVEAQFAGNYLYPPVNIVDGDLNTTWCEADENGSGIGEEITIELSEPVSFNEIQIVNGFASIEHPDYYKKNNRVKTIKLTQIAGEHFQTKEYELKDDCPDYQSINFELDQTAQIIAIKITDIYKGDKYDDTCLDDVRLLYNGKVIPFTQVKELKATQEENSREMLNSDFKKAFTDLFDNYQDNSALLLRQTGTDKGLYIEFGGGSDYVLYNCYWDASDKNSVEISTWSSTSAKLGNCRLTAFQRIDYVEVQVVKLIKVNGKNITINGVSYSVVPPTSDLQLIEM